jgi:hypothetical protein
MARRLLIFGKENGLSESFPQACKPLAIALELLLRVKRLIDSRNYVVFSRFDFR